VRSVLLLKNYSDWLPVVITNPSGSQLRDQSLRFRISDNMPAGRSAGLFFTSEFEDITARSSDSDTISGKPGQVKTFGNPVQVTYKTVNVKIIALPLLSENSLPSTAYFFREEWTLGKFLNSLTVNSLATAIKVPQTIP
jgi:hypothetical protein